MNAVIKRAFALSALCISLLLCASCAKQNEIRLPAFEDYDSQTTSKKKTSLKLGTVKGPYEAMFKEILEPLFRQKGYDVELVTYDNYIDPNYALARKDIDLNMFQHYMYLNSFKLEHNLDLSAISEVPTAAMGIYSHKYSSLGDLKNGAVIAIPNDSTNLTRALLVLSGAGIISLSTAVDTLKITLNDITQNPKNIEFALLDAQILSDALEDYDFAVINGNFAISSGLSLSDSLFIESIANHAYINVIAVRTDDLCEQFVMDFIAILRSKEYKDAIMEEDGPYSLFQYPCNFSENSN